MPVETQASQPCRFTAGDTVRWTLADSGHLASSWSLALTIRRESTLQTVAGVADGDSFTITIPAANSAQLSPGINAVFAKFTETGSGDVESAQQRPIEILPNLANATAGPRRAAYNSARAALDAKLLGDQSFSFNGQSGTSFSLSELQAIVDRLHGEALEEDRRLGIGTAGGLVRIVTRM